VVETFSLRAIRHRERLLVPSSSVDYHTGMLRNQRGLHQFTIHLSHFLRLTKAPRSVTFLDFVVGYLVALPVADYVLHLPMLIAIFVAFAILLYSGLYILNDLIDLREDRRHPIRRERLVASGRIHPASAGTIAILLIVLGLALGYLISPVVLVFETVFIFINLLYSIVLKRIPFLDLFGNTITHPMRTIFAICVFGQLEPRHWPIISGISIIWLLFTAQKRYKELIEESSASSGPLRRYSRGGLLALMISGCPVLLSLIFFADSGRDVALIATGSVIYLIVLIGFAPSKGRVRRLLDYIHTH